ncbi:MAG TPA: hypothetical protein PKH39_04770 [Woeseiaceae bacterium]|nr:hypothetical protein [Woeseiaceae bacterium]
MSRLIFASGNALLLLLVLSSVYTPANAMPAFAREYGVSCNVCHSAYPRLNEFGETFADDMNFRLPNWEQLTVPTGDKTLALPKSLPVAMRMQAFVQGRDGEAIDPVTGDVEADSGLDFQSPYLVKLLSSAPLSDQISYYFYAIFAEKGGNGEVIVEDAWFSYNDLFNTGIGAMLGQFQVSDVLFPREVRMTFQDFMLFRAAGITYDRGILFGKGVGNIDVSLGFVNGNGVQQNFGINSPGYRRPDRMFDNDTQKSVFGRLGGDIGPVSVGLFGLSGRQKNATGPAGMQSGDRRTEKLVAGIDVSGNIDGKWYWFGQYLWNRWADFLDPATDYEWSGAFAGVDYLHNEKWVFSALVNHIDAGDFKNTDTIYEGLEMRTVSVAAAYYFMRNVKGVIEANVDLLDDAPQTGQYFTGHLSQENYILIGIDAAF